MRNQAVKTIETLLEKVEHKIREALPSTISSDRFCRIVMTTIQTSIGTYNDLTKCDVSTLFAAILKASQLGLYVDGRESAIVSYKGTAQLLPMVSGIMKLARNSGEIANWNVQVVKKNDAFSYSQGDDPKMEHRPALSDRGPTIGAYSIVTLTNGERSREWMSREEIEDIRTRSMGGGIKGPWKTDYDEMAKKTVIRRHFKRLPSSSDIDGAMHDFDDAVGINAEKPSPPPKMTTNRILEQVAQSAEPETEPDTEPETEPESTEEPEPLPEVLETEPQEGDML